MGCVRDQARRPPSRFVDEAAANLLKLKALVVGGEPVALGVITGTGYSLTRPDGVLQLAVGALAA